jgi:hypothetical protein
MVKNVVLVPIVNSKKIIIFESIIKMKEYKHIFKRWIQRMYIDSARKMDYERGQRSKYELDCLSICKKLIDKPDSQLLMTPLSNKKYIHNPENSIFITIEGNTVNVINHKYSYTVVIQDKSKLEITNHFNEVLENQRLKMEEEITSNIKHSLKNILQTLV